MKTFFTAPLYHIEVSNFYFCDIAFFQFSFQSNSPSKKHSLSLYLSKTTTQTLLKELARNRPTEGKTAHEIRYKACTTFVRLWWPLSRFIRSHFGTHERLQVTGLFWFSKRKKVKNLPAFLIDETLSTYSLTLPMQYIHTIRKGGNESNKTETAFPKLLLTYFLLIS